MTINKVSKLGIELEQWQHLSCTADFGVGEDFATLYTIESKEQGKGHATELLKSAKSHYEKLGKKFGGTIALTERMRNVYKRLEILEYD